MKFPILTSLFLLGGESLLSSAANIRGGRAIGGDDRRRRLEPLSQDCTLISIAYAPSLPIDANDNRVGRSLGDSEKMEEPDDEFDCIIDNKSYPIHFDSKEQKDQMTQMLNNGDIVSGSSVLKHDGIMIGTDEASDDGKVEVFVPPGEKSYSVETDPSSRRRLQVTGDKPILAVRVTDSAGRAYPHDAATMSDNIFGSDTDAVNLKSQFAACSFNKLRITTDYSVDIDEHLAAPGVIEVTIPIALDGGGSRYDIHNAVTTAVQQKLGFNLPGPFQQVMYVLEKCYASMGCGWAAYAYVNSWMSVYQDRYYYMPGVQLHELGHNFGFAHSGGLNGQTYTDHTCLMGNPLYSDEIGKMCFNPAKNWQIGWYDDREKLIDATVARVSVVETMVGIADYQNNPDERNVIIKLESGTSTDFFVGFNRATGANSQNDEADDEVTIIQTGNNGQGYSQSFLKAHLVQGESYTIEAIGVTVKAESIDLTTNPATARISFKKGDASPTPAPTPCPSGKSVTVKVTTDNYPAETSWVLTNTCTNTNVLSAAAGSYTTPNQPYTANKECIPDGAYTFTISDVWGDGICCTYGNGSYEVLYDGQTVVSGASFGSSESKSFGSCDTDPSDPPTNAPTNVVTKEPTAAPTKEPTVAPTKEPTVAPTKEPTVSPTNAPTLLSTDAPTAAPTKTSSPSSNLALNGIAQQSSTCYGGVASRGNDGNNNGRYWDRSVTHTCRNSNGSWWKVDLDGENAIINEIVIWNREDCCSNRLTDSVVEILDRNGDVVDTKTIPTANNVEKFSFEYENVEGVEVRVRRPGSEFLSLAEVEVFGTTTTLPPSPPTVAPTAAPTKTPRPSLVSSTSTVQQSSTCYGGVASRGIDGNTNGRWGNRSVTHTCRNSNGSWWKVDLDGENAIVSEIVIWNREDCCSNRLTGSVVEIIDRDGTVVATNTIGVATNVKNFSFEYENVEGAQVRVFRPGSEFLSLAEVEVFGTVVTDAPTVSPAPTTSSPPTGTYSETMNLAREGTATQVCTGWGGVPSRAIDGNNSPYWSSGAISHTCRSTRAWWQVVLPEDESLIEKIVVWNRLDCCSDRLSNSKVQVIDKDGDVVFTGSIGYTGNKREFEFVLDTPVDGAIVKVTLDGTNYLQLSEVEVFGRKPLV